MASVNEEFLASHLSSLLSTIFNTVIHASKEGDLSLAHKFGIPLSSIKQLESVDGHQMLAISAKYFNATDIAEFITIDSERIGSLVSCAIREMDESRYIDKFITLGASKDMLSEFFGLHSQQIARRKEILNIKTRKGRKSNINKAAQLVIYDAWLESINLDYKDRYIYTAEKAKAELSSVYFVVKKIESDKNFYIELTTDCCA